MADKYKLYTFSYDSDVKPVSELAKDLKAAIDNVIGPGAQVAIVGHSMGGLVARSYMEEQGQGYRVLRLITLATPHHGSPAADGESADQFAKNANQRDSASLFSWHFECQNGVTINPFCLGANDWEGVAGYREILPFKLTDWSQANRRDLLWDNYDHIFPDSNADVKAAYLATLNSKTLYDNKIIAYSGYLDPNASEYSNVVSNVYTNGPLVELLSVAPSKPMLAASIAMYYGFARPVTFGSPFSLNDGAVPTQSSRFEGHSIAEVVSCPNNSHSTMHDGSGGPCEDGLPILDSVAVRLASVSGPPDSCFALVPVTTWKGEYFLGRDLSGSMMMVRNDDWDGDGFLQFVSQNGPNSSCGLGQNNFSVRWTRSISFAAGTYKFNVTADDGVRLYVDGTRYLDKWIDQAPTTYTVDITLSAGTHEIKVEYYQGGGGAMAEVSWSSTTSASDCIRTVPSDHWKGVYYGNSSLSGNPLMVRDDGSASLQVDSGSGSPSTACGIGVDQFSVRWTRTVSFGAGNYRFTTSTDDGMRLYLDGTKIQDRWSDQGASPQTVDVPISAGSHAVTVEYYENGGLASAAVDWQSVGSGGSCNATVPAGDWKGEYYANTMTLAGSPAMVRDDGAGALNRDFGAGSPSTACGIGNDNFSVRWTRTVSFVAGTYRFTTSNDDGMRLYIGDSGEAER